MINVERHTERERDREMKQICCLELFVVSIERGKSKIEKRVVHP